MLGLFSLYKRFFTENIDERTVLKTLVDQKTEITNQQHTASYDKNGHAYIENEKTKERTFVDPKTGCTIMHPHN